MGYAEDGVDGVAKVGDDAEAYASDPVLGGIAVWTGLGKGYEGVAYGVALVYPASVLAIEVVVVLVGKVVAVVSSVEELNVDACKAAVWIFIDPGASNEVVTRVDEDETATVLIHGLAVEEPVLPVLFIFKSKFDGAAVVTKRANLVNFCCIGATMKSKKGSKKVFEGGGVTVASPPAEIVGACVKVDAFIDVCSSKAEKKKLLLEVEVFYLLIGTHPSGTKIGVDR